MVCRFHTYCFRLHPFLDSIFHKKNPMMIPRLSQNIDKLGPSDYSNFAWRMFIYWNALWILALSSWMLLNTMNTISQIPIHRYTHSDMPWIWNFEHWVAIPNRNLRNLNRYYTVPSIWKFWKDIGHFLLESFETLRKIPPKLVRSHVDKQNALAT